MSVTFVWLEREHLSRRANGQCGIERHDPDIRADIDEDITGMQIALDHRDNMRLPRRVTRYMPSELWLLSIDDQNRSPEVDLVFVFRCIFGRFKKYRPQLRRGDAPVREERLVIGEAQ